jgi:hypothetical protein
VRVFFDTDYGDLNLAEPQLLEGAQQECVALTLALVNRVIDIYRLITQEDHVQRPLTVVVNWVSEVRK